MPNSKPSQTNWDKVRQDYASDTPIAFNPEDELYDPNDEAAVEAAWNDGRVTVRRTRGPQKAPKKVPVTIRLSPDVVEYFKAKGDKWQTEIDRSLRRSIDASRPASAKKQAMKEAGK